MMPHCMMCADNNKKTDRVMPLASMTGFSRGEGEHDNASWAWEIKSVNGKGLDSRCRLPNGFERLEPQVREAIQKRFKRGNFSVNLTLTKRIGDGGYRINWDVMKMITEAVPEIMAKCPDAIPPSVDGLLGLRGVIEMTEEETDEETGASLEAEVLRTLSSTLDELVTARLQEGAHLHGFLSEQVSAIEILHANAVSEISGQKDVLRDRIKQGVAELMDESPPLPEDRLAQEIAVLFTKADISEELDRLAAHCAAARGLLALDDPIGRKFDFLCQEFNREANTLCSKAILPALTTIGLELKVIIDQMREQVQNVE